MMEVQPSHSEKQTQHFSSSSPHTQLLRTKPCLASEQGSKLQTAAETMLWSSAVLYMLMSLRQQKLHSAFTRSPPTIATGMRFQKFSHKRDIESSYGAGRAVGLAPLPPHNRSFGLWAPPTAMCPLIPSGSTHTIVMKIVH